MFGTMCRSYQLPLTAWIVVGVIVFGVVIILIFTWIVFFYSICKNSMEYRKFVKVIIIIVAPVYS